MLPFEDIIKIISASCVHGEPVTDLNCTPAALKIDKRDLVRVAALLQSDPSLFFDMLSCITGIDNGPDTRTMDIAYNFYSIPFNHHLMVKVVVDRDNPEVDSLSSIYKTADWHERELFDMFGIKVNGHSDLRRILMPADWQGHPLRKDYKQQEYYRNIKLDY